MIAGRVPTILSHRFGILVNGQGQRFIAEDAYHGRIGETASRQPQGRVYLIADDESFGRPSIDGFEIAAVEESIADLEAAIASHFTGSGDRRLSTSMGCWPH